MFDLSERVVLVTGGSRGIGRAISVMLARAGAKVVVNYRSGEAAAQETVAAIREAGGQASASAFDVASAEDVDRGVSAVVEAHGRIDVLVTNAGIAIDQLLLRVKPEEVEKTYATNVFGAVYLAKAAIRPMMKQKHGRIIHLSSVVAEAGNPGQAVYASSKAALLGLTKTLAREYAGRGISVNAIAPGFFETDMTAGLNDKVRAGIIEQSDARRCPRRCILRRASCDGQPYRFVRARVRCASRAFCAAQNVSVQPRWRTKCRRISPSPSGWSREGSLRNSAAGSGTRWRSPHSTSGQRWQQPHPSCACWGSSSGRIHGRPPSAWRRCRWTICLRRRPCDSSRRAADA
jgi:3-oxoacyl-[acyl-carrier protein] reductase